MTWTPILALLLAIGLTVWTMLFLWTDEPSRHATGLVDDREVHRTLGWVRFVESAGVVRPGLRWRRPWPRPRSQPGTLDFAGLSFPLVIAAIAALIGDLRSLPATLIGGCVIGLVEGCLAAYFGLAFACGAVPHTGA